jgi:chitin disaccharide deacetylase
VTRVLIVNADDFGLTRGVSRGILECYQRGIVTSTTLMVNRDADPAQLEELRSSGLGVGLHVNLTLGTPISDPRRVGSLLDDAGQFVRDARVQAERARPEEARLEIGNQIEAFRRLMDRFPTHLDSHHHVARDGALLDLLCFFARALKIPMRAQDAQVRARAREEGIRTPEHFIGDAGTEPYWSAARVLEHLRTLPAGVSEFMTHPGYFDDELAYSRYGKQRETEVVGLTDPGARALVAREGIQLAHFGNL